MPLQTDPSHHSEYKIIRQQAEAAKASNNAKLFESVTAEIARYATPIGTEVLRTHIKGE